MNRESIRHTDHVDRVLGSDSARHFCAIVLGLVSVIVWFCAGSTGFAKPDLGFFLAVLPLSAAAAAAFGLRAGLATAAFAAFFGWYLILPPELSFAFRDAGQTLYFGFVLVCAILAAVIFGSRRATAPKL